MVDVPLPGLREWLLDGLLVALVAVLMIRAAYSYRHSTTRKWLPALGFALMYGMSAGMAILSDTMEETLKEQNRRLKEPAPPVHLEPDWGKAFEPENRVRWSQMLARHSFYDWGMHQKHFDLDGRLIEYIPTAEDLKARRRRIEYIAEAESAYRMIQVWTVIWLFLPLACLGLSLLIRRGPVQHGAPGDAPPNGVAPPS